MPQIRAPPAHRYEHVNEMAVQVRLGAAESERLFRLAFTRVDAFAATEPPSDHGGLQLGALRRRMGSEISRGRDQNMATRLALPPFPILTHTSLEYLVDVEACVLAQHRARERGDQHIERVEQQEIACNEAHAPRIRRRQE